jgi:meiotically up-regulated gene 157 (Mug157) protein
MTSRRDFLKTSGLIITGFAVGANANPLRNEKLFSLTTRRPPLNERKFVSKAIEDTINEIKANVKNDELVWMFENCFPNTLDTTVNYKILNGKPDTFVITGDINAMWLRDSSAQVWPYLPYCNKDAELKKLIAGVINRHTKCILIDPYANAFNEGPTGSEWKSDFTEMKPELHERKWEVDSLCYPIRLAYRYWKETGDTSCFGSDWQNAIKKTYDTFIEQQRKNEKGPYHFQRRTETQTDTVANSGYGNPVKPVGLICSIFRPSDDSTIYPFLIPSNLFAIVSLRQTAEIFIKVVGDQEFASKLLSLADEVYKAVQDYAIIDHLQFGKMYAYEVDGFGNQLFMDDTNVPSLLALPYLGCCTQDDLLYLNTRKFVLSDSNPYFFSGKYGEGICGPHVGMDMIWPMSIIVRALTSDDDTEIKTCINTLLKTHADTGFMHESFNKDNPSKFSRSWFAWANTLFGELILKIYHNKPHLLS